MSTSMERRVGALEIAQSGGVDFILVLRRIVRPGIEPGEVTAAQMMGQRFERMASESEDEFVARLRHHASENRRPGQHGVQVLCDERDLDL